VFGTYVHTSFILWKMLGIAKEIFPNSSRRGVIGQLTPSSWCLPQIPELNDKRQFQLFLLDNIKRGPRFIKKEKAC